MSKRQLKWLKYELETLEKAVIIFMHHPPVLSGVPFMDNKHFLKNYTDFQRIAFQYPYPIHIFCGHYHVEKTVSIQNLHVYITPSTFYQIDWREAEFKVDHYRIAFREIDITGGMLRHGLHYLDGNVLPKK